MLTPDDAKMIVHLSVGQLSNAPRISPHLRLDQLGIVSDHSLASLRETIVSDPHIGLAFIRSNLHPGRSLDITSSISIDDLVKSLQLSAGKLCSNPSTPHEQPCCPYPKTCDTCMYPVI
jgi:hypothetical protein